MPGTFGGVSPEMSDPMTVIKISDSQWEMIEAVLPPEPGKNLGGRPPTANRKCFEGILWILREGLPWSELPACYGSRSSVNRRFLTWKSKGVWIRMLDLFARHLTDSEERLFWLAILEKMRLPKPRSRHSYKIRRLPYRIVTHDSTEAKTDYMNR